MRHQRCNDRLARCYAALLADVLNVLGARQQCMAPGMRCWGEAATLYRQAVAEPPQRPYRLEMEVSSSQRYTNRPSTRATRFWWSRRYSCSTSRREVLTTRGLARRDMSAVVMPRLASALRT